MSDNGKKFLIDSVIGLVIAVVIWIVEDLVHAASAADVFRILSDGFFVAGIAYLAMGGLTWTKNGGVMDGLGFTFKTAFARVRSDFDTARMTFGEYRESREKKASSPKPALLAGLMHTGIALVLFLVYLVLTKQI